MSVVVVLVNSVPTMDIQISTEPDGEGVVLRMAVEGVKKLLVALEGDNLGSCASGVFVGGWVLTDFDNFNAPL